MTTRWVRLSGLVLALFAAACFVGTGEDQGAPPEVPPASPGQQEDGTMTVEEFEQDTEGAVEVAEAYWAQRVRDFEPVRRIVPYRQEGEVACGGQPLTRNNAAYCSAGDFIAYDVEWAVGAFRQIGDAFIFYLLGHEYAHAVQVRLGIQYRYTIQQELQADCMAGAYIGDSVKAGGLTLARGDLDEFRRGLLAVGDDPGQPWFAPNAHGTAQQRTNAFFEGYEGSLEPCDL
ncbi:neutral zinc metallopeptidase [Phytohabitans kaempferiae]|uniref:Neutral zinc metallopeptidase n=1 Tax=Phytohabitans kaempferiae TaxID=1620943 RepID=A0ABV6LZD9_9ACTN